MKHSDRVVLITGSTQGIGLATAVRFASEGARLVLNGRSSGENVENALKLVHGAGADAIFIEADVGAASQLEQLTGGALEKFGQIDVAIWNASFNMKKPFLDYVPADLEAVNALNFGGYFHFARQVLPGMKARGFGRLLATVSSAPYLYAAGFNLSGASKAAVISLMKHLATEFAPNGITCNAVGPGLTRTGLAEEFSLTDADLIAETVPAGRIGEPEEVAAAFSYLASDEAAYVTGQVLHANGGRYM
ncbi:MAG: SDR family oxidoreductase [Alphaproteobacteria bacterium]|nr:SDR family oxidoreductase [Alphaproteobacteria bacterium]